ncbi:phosphatase PAP2 family protein [bacterium]|nr:phosphatase PAP2 family protein [bacterium]
MSGPHRHSTPPTAGRSRSGRRAAATLVVLALAGVTAPREAAAQAGYRTGDGVDAPLVVGGVLAYGLGWWLDRGDEPGPAAGEPLDPAALNALDRSAVDNWSPAAARASDWLVAACAAAPLGLALDAGHGGQRDDIAVMYLETALVTTGITYLLKNLVGRPRPYAYSDDPAIPAALRGARTTTRSFPSGHTANAFAAMVFFATVYTRLHPDADAEAWVWGGCLAAASTTGYLRYRAGRHFPTDILAGASVGALVGWAVPRAHETVFAEPAGARGGEVRLAFGFGF